MKIYAPVKDTNGVYASVMFRNGVGETDKPHLIEWFKRNGYTIEGGQETITAEITENTSEPDFNSMTPNDLRDWMREHGYGSKIKNIRNKEKLLEILRG